MQDTKKEDPVIVQTDVDDKVRLDDKYNFQVKTTVGLAPGGDFYLKIMFFNLTMEELKVLAEFWKLARQISILSELIEKEKYNITHIVLTNMSANNGMEMTWECLSDDPSLYESLIIN